MAQRKLQNLSLAPLAPWNISTCGDLESQFEQTLGVFQGRYSGVKVKGLKPAPEGDNQQPHGQVLNEF